MNTNPLLLSQKIPGQTVRLPSNGVFYKNGELDENVKNGELHVFPLTAYHEILLKSADFLMNGVAVEKVFNDCIPEIKKPLDLITKDVDFLFVCLRKITFGDEIDFDFTHGCDNAKKHTYVINMSSLLSRTVRIDPTTVESSFSLKLDSGYIVKTKPLKFKDFIVLNQTPSNKLMTPEDQFEFIVDSLLTTIYSVTTPDDVEISDKELIKEWVKRLSANDVRSITSNVNENSKWGPIFNATCKCKDCNEEFEVDIPVNPVLVFF